MLATAAYALTRTDLTDGLAWLHVPKTGSSAGTLFGSTMHMDPCCYAQNFANLVCYVLKLTDGSNVCNRSGIQSDNASMIHHVPFWPSNGTWGYHVAPDKRVFHRWHGRFVGFFRDPQVRAISAISFWGLPEGTSVVRGLQRTAGTATRMLAGQAGGEECNDQVSGRTCPDDQPPPNQELALHRLDGFAFIGLTDAWALSVCLFRVMHGGPCTRADFSNSNPTAGSESRNWSMSTGGRRPSVAELKEAASSFVDEEDTALFGRARARFCADLDAHNISHAVCRRKCASAAAEMYTVPANDGTPGERTAICPGREPAVLRYVPHHAAA